MRLITLLLSMVLAFAATQATATTLDRKLDSAAEVLQQMSAIPEKAIPASLLSNAYAVAVVPNVIKAGFFVAGSFGKGVLVVRNDDGRWSNPSFIRIGAGSVGWQFGAKASDIVLVFKSKRSVENIARGKITLGGDISIAAGPVGRHTSAATDGQLKAEIYSYARSRGAFIGLSMEGGWIRMDNKANFAYYQSGQNSARQILADEHMPAPASARNFVAELTARTPRLNQSKTSRTAQIQSQPPVSREPEGARTFSFDEAPAPQSDSIY